MTFDTLNPRLQKTATKALAFCKTRYGGNGLKIDEGIAPEIAWRPTFHFRPTRFVIVAVEVEDNLYPEALKGAAHEISHFDWPISVFQACSLDAYQNDPKQAKVNLLRKHGFGIITVDEDGRTTVQHQCIPLAQHISAEQLDSELAGLTSMLKVKFREAHGVYLTNEGQGLQQAGQIVEALINAIAVQAVKKNAISGMIGGKDIANTPLADVIDALYATNIFKNHRAALGGARDFIKEFRNTASHAPRSAKQAAEKIKKCKTGFLDSISVAVKLRNVMHQLGYNVKIHIT